MTSVPVWVVLAQVHTESRGYVRPEDHFGGPDYAAEGILQIQPIAAKDCGTTIHLVDGAGPSADSPDKSDAINSFDCWAKLQRRYVGPDPATVWDWPLLWLAGSGTFGTVQQLREEGYGLGPSWVEAADRSGALSADYLIDYANRWFQAAGKYYQWSRGTT